jgi:hypothetical protein
LELPENVLSRRLLGRRIVLAFQVLIQLPVPEGSCRTEAAWELQVAHQQQW